MEVTFTIPEDIGRQLLLRAQKEGTDISALMAKIAEREAKKPTLDQLLAPVRRQFLESGLSEDDLTRIVREERRALPKRV